MRSIRGSLSRSTSVVVFCVVMVFCAAGFLVLRGDQIERFEFDIETDLNVVANAVKVWTNGDVYVELNPTLLKDFASGGPNAYAIRDAEGINLIERSVSLEAANRDLNASPGGTSSLTAWSEASGPNEMPAVVATRVFAAQWGWDLDDTSIEVEPGVRETMVEITVSHDRSTLDAALRNLALLAILMTLGAAAAAGIGVWVLAGRALRPLDELATRTSQIDEATDAKPFTTDGPAELRPIANGLNTLLARLTGAALRERRFTADAAHELRTPIAELRTLTDVALAFPDDPARLESVVRTSNELSVRLSSLVDALLGIARREAVVGDLQSEAVDCPALIRRLISDKDAVIASKNMKLVFDGPDTHQIETDAALLTSILTNLIGNAVAHAPDGALIRMIYSGGSTGFRLDIINPVADLSMEDLDKIFEPFWRKQGTHSNRSHSGLGLTLSRNFADLLGYDLSANLLKSGEVQMTLASKYTA